MKSYCACEWTVDGHIRDLCGAHMEAVSRAVQREREACARLIEDGQEFTWLRTGKTEIKERTPGNQAGLAFAAAIRARRG